MKRKLLSVLLVLTMCVGLAVSAFAEPAEEFPVPEETGTFPVEEAQDIPDSAMENGESEWVVGEVCYGHVHWLEEYEYEEPFDGTEEAEESIVEVGYGYVCFDASCQSLMLASDTTSEGVPVPTDPTEEEESEEAECEGWHLLAKCEYEKSFEGPGETEEHTVTVTFWEPCDGSCQDSMLAKSSSQPSWYCPKCGNVDWDDGKVKSADFSNINEATHTIKATIVYVCQTCRARVEYEDKWTEPHDWFKGSFAGYQSSGADGHKAVYNYSCICGKTTTKPESTVRPHSLTKTDFGDDYHRGALHYVEWFFRCTTCGYQETRWESQSCPGNNNGEGCIFGINKVEPPVEEQDVTEPEENAAPDDGESVE